VTEELSTGQVGAFSVGCDGVLRYLGRQPTGGAGPCHLAVDPDGHHLLVAHYTGGSIAVLPIETNGSIGPRCELVEFSGSDADSGRQEAPHSHMVRTDPTGRWVVSTDLGTDSLHVHKLAARDGHLLLHATAHTSRGDGPRHFVFHPSGHIYATAELTSKVLIFAWDLVIGEMTPLGEVAATATAPPRRNYPAEIVLGTDGRHCYVANRGADCITVFEVLGAELIALVDVPSGGRGPRHLAIAGGYLYVANQESGSVVAFQLDRVTGIPGHARVAARIPSPACVLPMPE
jgi:6-phosphogluconolactonase (cycloisomerase 2 family)